MKRMTAVLAFITLLLFSSSVVWAQKNASADSISQQREQEIKSGLQAMASYVLKYTPPDTLHPADSTSASAHKTWANVLDKALDMFSSTISEIAGTVEKAAPAIWKIMVRQQYAKAAGELIVPMGILIFIVFIYFYMKKKWTPAVDNTVDEMIASSDHGWAWGWRIFCTKFLPLLGGIITGGFLIDAIQKAVLLGLNPYYYAIRDILVLLLGKTYGM